MTTIVEMPLRFDGQIKKIIDSRSEFKKKIKKSQIITYSVEFFSSCFLDDPRHMKGIHVRLYNLQQDQRPEINNYVISWEDIPRNDEEDWNNFQSKVNDQLEAFLFELKEHTNVVEGSL
ncbi:MAG: hypothetical protein KGD59_14420 [Candidatus Heimdallarchaeota archaeon]|nr:hypothetical protein [Candidatus Heimdallarchaeota archaeon]MBY8995742.1 hypothetical protein [Candidatus Heimdallarchaeota archaeon]